MEGGVLDWTGELRQREHVDDDGSTWHDVEAYLDALSLVALLDELAQLPTDTDYGARPPTAAELEAAMRNYLEAVQAAEESREPPGA